jgi:hypothetical protein
MVRAALAADHAVSAMNLAYPVIAWLCWLPNIIVVEWLLNQTQSPSPRSDDLLRLR